MDHDNARKLLRVDFVVLHVFGRRATRATAEISEILPQGFIEGYMREANTAVKKVKKSCPRSAYRPAAMTSAITAMTSFGVEAIFLGA